MGSQSWALLKTRGFGDLHTFPSMSSFVSILHLGTSQSSCRINSGLGEPCKFPYKLNGKFYAECTTDFKAGSTDPMCPIRLENDFTLETSQDPADWGRCANDCDLQEYSSNQDIFDDIVELSRRFSYIAKPFSIGLSSKGQQLVGIRISKDIRKSRKLMKPMVRFVGNMHGNEPVGREVLLHLSRHLLQGYDADKRIRKIIDETDISILPSLNPDGFDRATKGSCSGTGKLTGAHNEGGMDLNRDYPTWDDYQRFLVDEDFDPFQGGRQPETLAMMEWSVSPFVLSANLHDGAVLVTYPYDHFRGEDQSKPHLTPDNDIFHHLAETYASNHATMVSGTKCFRRAQDGIANGAMWHSGNSTGAIEGSLKDFSYLFSSNLDLSFHLTCCKYPESFFLLREWENNKRSLLAYLEQVQMGIKGIVSLEGNRPQGGADIIIWNPDGKRRAKTVGTSEEGEFWKILLPGQNGNNTYKIQARFEDCSRGGSGRIYESLQHKVIVSYKNPLKIKQLRMRNVGFCGVKELDERQLIEQLSFIARAPKKSVQNVAKPKKTAVTEDEKVDQKKNADYEETLYDVFYDV